MTIIVDRALLATAFAPGPTGPTISPIADVVVNVGDTATSAPTIVDADGDLDTIVLELVHMTLIGNQGWTRNLAITAITPTVTGAAAPVTWSAVGLPVGVTIDPSNGTISGTPTTASSGQATVTATGTGGFGVSQTFQWAVAIPAAITVDPIGDQDWTVGVTYTVVATARNAIGPVSWSVTGAPDGLTLAAASNGVLTGVPEESGTGVIAMTATASNGSATALFQWTASGLSQVFSRRGEVNSTLPLSAPLAGTSVFALAHNPTGFTGPTGVYGTEWAFYHRLAPDAVGTAWTRDPAPPWNLIAVESAAFLGTIVNPPDGTVVLLRSDSSVNFWNGGILVPVSTVDGFGVGFGAPAHASGEDNTVYFDISGNRAYVRRSGTWRTN